MTQPQPATVQMDDAAADSLARLGSTLDAISETLRRIARAVEAMATTGD